MTLILDAGGVSALAGQRARLMELRRSSWPNRSPEITAATSTPIACCAPAKSAT